MCQQLSALVPEIRLREKQALSTVQQATDRAELAGRDPPREVHGERDGQDQDLWHAGIHGKEGCVIGARKYTDPWTACAAW